MKIVYFAWVREIIGKGQETLTPPTFVKTPEMLLEWLCTQSDIYKKAFSDKQSLRCAINHDFCPLNAPITNDDEVAFFPPVTGG